jgi:curved DNA-binding protein CbpA
MKHSLLGIYAMDFYQILGVPPTASYEQVKAAYRVLARQYHPDLNPGMPHAEETFKMINVAYEVLKDPERRAKYDLLRAYGIDPSNVYRRNPEEIDLEELLVIFRKEFDEFVNAVIKDLRRFFRSLNPFRAFRKILFGS